MRIPTLLGLSVIIIAIMLAIMYQAYQQEQQQTIQTTYTPQNIRFSNLSGNSFTVTWTSTVATIGSLGWGSTTSLGQFTPDDRDLQVTAPRFTHSVTLTGLTENTPYYFKLRNGPYFYPEQPLSLKTLTKLPLTQQPPVIGRVLNSNQDGVDDALVFLEIPGANLLSSFVATAGNFILPLATLRSNDGVNPYNLTNPVASTLQITNQQSQSQIKILVPTTKPLPPIILGQNLDFTTLDATISSPKKP